MLNAMSFQDDLTRVTKDPIAAQMGNDRLEALAETKLLSYNMTKTSINILGAKKAREDLIKNPPTIYGEKVKIVEQESYLGDELGFNASESISLTLKKRLGLAKKSIFEIRTIIDDMRMKTVGGITTALLLWESCTLQVFLHKSSTWLDMKKKDVEKLVKLQNLFFNTTLGIQNCPVLFMLLELGILSIPLRLLKEQDRGSQVAPQAAKYHHTIPRYPLNKILLNYYFGIVWSYFAAWGAT